ncbi:ABC transporter ATP-binding protein [Nakamurella antarctica]|uniref:ABC transporter ATP-binding protein n=1 Tax=Nakamurella antarctica TaxID=1902245 RepID=A0A3G8ZJK8_9ACTN|nr:ATP-binding cassette domain-containing protein [Nakamurella antarctica]AZI57539.1 ABC transporter ATP-binding protein [Nakamurella antarctica]
MTNPMLDIRGLTLAYGGAIAVRGATLSVASGEIHGIVGESGSGKTSLAKAVLGQLLPVAGQVRLAGVLLPPTHRSVKQRRAVQMVYQDPYSSLNPRMTVGQVLSELLRVHDIVGKRQITARSRELLDLVQLPAGALGGYPGQFSGGQRQRIAIARALAVQPTVLVADEPTSALDASSQASILALFENLRKDLGLTVLLITHNLAVVNYLCDRVSVMKSGQIVETADVGTFFTDPQHPYSKQMLLAVPRMRRTTASAETEI